ncbi:TetR family transcriptional regulator [Xanthomonas arboricola pv. arracaciae]|uniref:TetR/AcrR family transcriptional regulator n=1 Tax=Xanthomonas arboricola TaxID=56448 RepID=UPI000CEED116|nr:TetR/AcrR family transcriptional regulator [Xanthomonas arboricola]PPT90996.1 TetR family transcriptional regulator [Xanthomonas arboricola pv. arracaciae]
MRKARRGRPPASEAGLAEERVLEAATDLFLELGFGRTTLDKVSERSGAGKSALYGKYADKAALFAAVAERSIHQMFAELAPMSPGGDVAERLRHVGMELANSLLVPRCVALMRITAAEAVNFPDLATMAYRVSFEGSVHRVVAALAPASPAAPSKTTIDTAKRFVELALHSVSFQAAYGAPIELLRERCASDVEDAILLLGTKGLLTD